MFRSSFLIVAAGALASGLSVSDAAARNGYYMQPDLHGERIVFVSEHDLWTVPRSGGRATRLTAYEGAESAPHFSPDGSSIAFTAQYEGDSDVYVMDADGGEPHRLTFYPGTDESVGWSPDGESIYFRS